MGPKRKRPESARHAICLGEPSRTNGLNCAQSICLDQCRLWVGRDVLIRSEVQRQHRNRPSVPLRVLKVQYSKADVLIRMRHSKWPEELFTDRWKMGQDPAERYLNVSEDLGNLEAQRLIEVFVPSDISEDTSDALRDLSDIMPLFQIRGTPLAPADFTGLSGIQRMLACALHPFEPHSVFQAWEESSGIRFQTRCPDVVARARAILAQRSYTEKLLNSQTPLPLQFVRIGIITLRPWQAVVVAHCMRILRDAPDAWRVLIQKSLGSVHFSAVVPAGAPLCILRAAPGKGKTFVAAAVASRTFSICITASACCRQWVREAGRLGVYAVSFDRGFATLEHSAESLKRRPQQLWVLPRSLLLRHLRQLDDEQFFPPPPEDDHLRRGTTGGSHDAPRAAHMAACACALSTWNLEGKYQY